MATPSDISSSIRAQLRITEPDLDTSVGSVTRKIIDAVAESVAEFTAESFLTEYGYDIDLKFGADLDEFVELFGVTRQTARRASGTVTFQRNTASPTDIPIPVGTQIATSTSPNRIAATVVPAILQAGDTAINVPSQMVSGGADGNIAPNSIARIVTEVQGINSVTNSGSFTGGRDAENDSSLRTRFRSTVFQNLAGTSDQYLSVALGNQNVTNANVIGSSKRYREQMDIVSGSGTSTIADARTIFPGSATLGVDIDGGNILVEGVHYTFNSAANPPTVTVIDAVTMPDGVYDLTFKYEPNASRNDFDNGITNRVDIYTAGSSVVEATDVLKFQTSKVFTNTSTDTLFKDKFLREDGTAPTVGNYFVRYGFSPVVNPSLNDTVTIGATTYTVGTDAFLVNDVTNEGMAFSSLSGVELKSAGNGGPAAPADGSIFTVSYAYNDVPRQVANSIERWRLLTQDVMVHAAKPIILNLYFAVILEPGFTASGIKTDLMAALNTLIAQSGFSNVLQTSDILRTASSVAGVDAVRFLTSTDDGTNYAIQRVANDLTTVLTTYADVSGRAIDVVSDDDELPSLNDLTIDIRANNTFHIGQ